MRFSIAPTALAVIAGFLLLLPLPAAADIEPGRKLATRGYLEIGGDQPLYRVTKIVTSDEFRSETVHLIEDISTADRLVFRSEIDYSRAVSSVELFEPKTKQAVILSFRLPLDVISRSDFNHRADELFSAWGTADPEERIIAGGFEEAISEDLLKDREKAREIRTRIRQELAPQFLEMMERLRITAGTQLGVCEAILQKVLYSESCSGSSLESVPREADCEWDHSFGYPCSKGELEMLEQLREAGKSTTFLVDRSNARRR